MLDSWRAEPVCQRGDCQSGDRQQHEHGDRTSALGVEPLGAVLESANEERRSEDEQQIGENRADERGLDDVDQSGAQRKDGDEQLGQVAERRLQDAGGARAKAISQLFDTAAHQCCEQCHGDGSHGERRDCTPLGVVRKPSEEDHHCATTEDNVVRSYEDRRSGRGAHRHDRVRPEASGDRLFPWIPL